MSNWVSKHRPQSFKTFQGNKKEIEDVLEDIKGDDPTQTWMLTGKPGAGKTTLAYLIARSFLGLKISDDIEKCRDFEEMNANEDGSKETILNMINNTKFKPIKSPYKVILIDEVHKLSPAAASALLKATEKPPQHVVYITATNEPHKVLDTIRQRCKTVFLSDLTQEELEAALLRIVQREELENVTSKVITYIASRFVGQTRLAITTLKSVANKLKNKKAGKLELKELEAAIEEAVKTDYEIGGGILEKLYMGEPQQACEITATIKDHHHAINTMLDLNNALIQTLAGLKTYQNVVRQKLWKALKANKTKVSLSTVLKIQEELFKLKKTSSESPMLDIRQVLLYTVATMALTIQKER